MTLHKPSIEPDPMATKPGPDDMATKNAEQLAMQRVRVITPVKAKAKDPSPLGGIRPASRKPSASERLKAVYMGKGSHDKGGSGQGE
jgi:hypothetical protein